ncbi:DUF4277 domain-containing protein [Streptomyces sp. NPDC058625]|uniref:DUF4277 domain-containing protein n=1 Tax=Streptomyces sp. NPDC058625 TaxID=3346564 RepID=UPI003653496C
MIESVVTKRLGALPVAAEFLRRLDVAGIVDALCPPDPRAEPTHGQMIEVLGANRLTAPALLFRDGDRARSWAVEKVFGVEAHLLGDDRLARALDAIAPHLDRPAGSVGAAAIAGFGIGVARTHWDMTSMSVHGAYPEAGQDEDYPMVKFGHPKDRRVDLKQVRAWHFDEQVPAAQAAADGWYALVASRPIEQATPAQVLLDYRGQGDAERRYGDVKGATGGHPSVVQHARRVAALVQIVCLALLVFCLIERQVRQALERDGDGTMPGIHPGRRRVRPTGRMILHHLGELQLRIRRATDPPTIILSQVVRVDLIDPLGPAVRRPRWLQT